MEIKRNKMESSNRLKVWPNLLLTLLFIASSSLKLGFGLKSGQMGPTTQCGMSEFTCTNGKCVPLNKYCDNINDCGDSSDEPRFCSRCNRTYYGDIGVTYDLELHRPKEDKIPYTCMLTFTAAGGMHGDIVQVTLESFTLGKFTSYTQNGCPDGYLQISEASRTPIGGMWCGTTWGPAIFYSETRSLVLTVKLFKLSRDQSGYNFDFRIQYKVLSRDSAVVRYGGIKYEEIQPWTNGSYIPSTAHLDEFTNSTVQSEHYGLHEAVNNNYKFYKERYQDNKKDKILEKSVNYTEPKYYLGDLIPGTYCSRIFSNCDKKVCRLQSPNFPGIYPRNLTCYYAVRQHDVPPGKHALITVSQPKGNLIWISTDSTAISSAASSTPKKNDKEKTNYKIKTWDECDHVQDYITVYDGYTTRDPIILKFCGGGSVPNSISSGPELLVEFTTSPYGTFVTSQPNVNSLYGFQLEVEVKFVDIQSPTYAKSKRLCEFWIRGMGHGVLENPKHSLSPNTTCLYHLQGTEAVRYGAMDQLSLPRRASSSSQTPTRFKIWISVLKFEMAPKFGAEDETLSLLQTQEDCSGMLRIWDGPLRDVPICKDLDCAQNERDSALRGSTRYTHNHTNVIARFCRGSVPKSCDHGVLSANNSRPCLLSESFVSSTDFVTLELKATESTVLRPLGFTLRYEFVDYLQDGQAIGAENECHRKFVSSLIERREPSVFRSVRNIFKFGRGGTHNMSCIYRFEAQRGERVRIVVNKIMTGNRSCASKIDTDIFRSYCFGDSSAKLEIFERPWHDSILFPRGCACNSTNSSHLPIIYTSTGREVEVHFTATNMTVFDDPDSLNFEATFEFVRGPMNCKDIRKKSGSDGEVSLAVGDMECRNRPWLIESESGKYLYVRIRGLLLRKYNPLVHLPLNTSMRSVTPMRCNTKSRVVITNGEGLSVTACPLDSDASKRHVVEVFSAGWNRRNQFEGKEPPKAISVEFLEPEDGDFSFSWLELTKRPAQGLEDCQYKCPELEACVNATIWCDGISQCPSGYDESFTHCSALLRLPGEILAALCLFLLLLCCGVGTYIYRKIRRSCRRSSVLQTRLKSLSSMDTAVFDEKDVIC